MEVLFILFTSAGGLLFLFAALDPLAWLAILVLLVFWGISGRIIWKYMH